MLEMLELRNITKSFDGLTVINDLSISFEEGMISGLIGPNGAGKTTLFNIISGLIQPDRGEMLYKGKHLNGLIPWKRAQIGIGRLWQDVRIFEKMTVLENVLLARKGNPGEGVFSNFLRPLKVRQFDRQNVELARHWLKFVGLVDKERAPAGELSYGQQKLLAIARLLVNDADLLLLDEPTSGIHPRLIDAILEVIRTIAREGKTVIIIEHNFSVVLRLSDSMFLMDKGRIELTGTPKEIMQASPLKEKYLGV